MIAPTLRGVRGVYRPLMIEDAPALFVAHADPVVHHFWSGPAHGTLEGSIAHTTATLAVKNSLHWAITRDGGEALGRMSLVIPREGVGEIGVILRADAQGNGLCGEALRLVAAHGFGALGLHRIQADIDPDNAASLRLFERNGFQREGVLRANWKTHIGLRDSVILARFAD
ncbi:MAG: GNAT family N-acetyltransferase [Hyphomonadaceae bacterium]|nr:MAG: N-acetyltransferase GCN5 [Caulobacteraceae bacterium]MBT9444612.1 GNAT family N-acetyltransferase [Hyphomonadaceae bacterium]TPW04506.1 MAG: N-acetyltransferase GCN5 [Alphaproteobacteria bacterium]